VFGSMTSCRSEMDGFCICASEFAFLFLWIGFGGLNETVVVAGHIVWTARLGLISCTFMLWCSVLGLNVVGGWYTLFSSLLSG
jgi:hypothetical protein